MSTPTATSPARPPPVSPTPAPTLVMSPPESASTWHTTVPSWLIARILDPVAHMVKTRRCTNEASTPTVTAPVAPPPLIPTPALTDVMSPPPSESTWQTTEPSSPIERMLWPRAQAPTTRLCTLFMSADMVRSPLNPPPSIPVPATTDVTSPLSLSTWHTIVPSSLIARMLDPVLHPPATRRCILVVSTAKLTSPVAPPPDNPVPAATPVTSPTPASHG